MSKSDWLSYSDSDEISGQAAMINNSRSAVGGNSLLGIVNQGDQAEKEWI
jgi:hypothetical protein